MKVDGAPGKGGVGSPHVVRSNIAEKAGGTQAFASRKAGEGLKRPRNFGHRSQGRGRRKRR